MSEDAAAAAAAAAPAADFANYPGLVSFFSAPQSKTYPALSPANADLSGRSVFVTGASQGIGRLVAVTFAKAGCSKIAVSSRGAEASLQPVADDVRRAAAEAGHPEPQVLSLGVDVTSEEDVKRAAEAVSAAFGGSLDVLVNNAGTLEQHALVADSEPLDWWHTWEVNVRGTYLATRFFLPLLLASELKSVVNLTSGLAVLRFAGYASYGTSKVALCRFTEFLALEYGPRGLLAFSFEPGLTDTRMGQQMHPALRDIPKDEPELGPETMLWLVRERREWLSGRIVSARWDVEELLKRKDEIVEKDLMKFKVALE